MVFLLRRIPADVSLYCLSGVCNVFTSKNIRIEAHVAVIKESEPKGIGLGYPLRRFALLIAIG